jgi:uncharacterized damage-inducible protein DinB
MALREILLAEFDHEMAATRRLLAVVPDRALPWKPHERARSTGELVWHIITIAGWGAHILDVPRFDLDETPPPAAAPETMDAMLLQFTDATRRARTLVDRSEAELAAQWSLRQGGQELFSLPRAAAFRTFVLGHVVHHRGQLSVYLRMNDVPIPSIYGPSADTVR